MPSISILHKTSSNLSFLNTLLTSFSCIHNEFIKFISHAFFQTFAVDLDLVSIAKFCLTHGDLEWAVGDVLTISEHIY